MYIYIYVCIYIYIYLCLCACARPYVTCVVVHESCQTCRLTCLQPRRFYTFGHNDEDDEDDEDDEE